MAMVLTVVMAMGVGMAVGLVAGMVVSTPGGGFLPLTLPWGR